MYSLTYNGESIRSRRVDLRGSTFDRISFVPWVKMEDRNSMRLHNRIKTSTLEGIVGINWMSISCFSKKGRIACFPRLSNMPYVRPFISPSMRRGPKKTAEIAAATKVRLPIFRRFCRVARERNRVLAAWGRGWCYAGLRTVGVDHLDIVNAVEPIHRIKTCPLELKSHGKRLCSLHRRMDESLRSVEDAFASTTLAELLEDRNPSVPCVIFSGKKGSKAHESAS